MSAHRYEVWAQGGALLANYKTLGQALLGALWRSKKIAAPVYVYDIRHKGSASSMVARVASGWV